MIIGNNNSNKNFSNQVRPMGNENSYQNNQLGNNFENRWNQTQKQNQTNNQIRKNVFVKDIKQQHYADSSNTSQMQDRTLAMLHERLQQGTITMEEFNQRCAALGQQRQNMNKNNKLF